MPRFHALAFALVLAPCVLAQADTPTSGPITLVPGPVDFSDVAYDAANDVYAAVWQAGPPGGKQLLAQLVNPDGTLRGGQISVSSLGGSGRSARIANVNGRDRFVIVWAIAGQISAVTLDAATGSLGSELPVATGLTEQLSPRVTGNASPMGDSAIVVWPDAAAQAVQLARLEVDAAGALTVSDTRAVPASLTVFTPLNVAPTGGDVGRHLVVWDRAEVIYAMLVDESDLTILAGPTALNVGSSNRDVPIAAGDGTHWLVLYQFQGLFSSDADIAGRRVSYDATAGTLRIGTERFLTTSSQDEAPGDLAVTENSMLLVYATGDTFSVNSDVRVRTLDPFTCEICEGDFGAEPFAVTFGGTLSVASETESGGSGERALVTWNNGVLDPRLAGQTHDANDGVVVEIDPGCGEGGVAHAKCSVAGNSDFEFRLTDAAPGVPVFLGLSSSTLNMPCGPCVWVPRLATGVLVAAGNTDGGGEQAVPIPLPNIPEIVGVPLYAQWFVFTPSPGCIAIDFSSALRVEIDAKIRQ